MSGRRDFLKGLAGGVVAGFPAIIPSSALGRDGYVAPSEKIVMGAIGVGRQGSGDREISFLMKALAVSCAAAAMLVAGGLSAHAEL